MTRGSVGHTHRRRRARKRNDRARQYENQRNLWDTRWTPNTEELRALIWVAVREANNRRTLCIIIGMKARHLRRIIGGHSKAVSFNVVDRILARSSVAHQINDLPWLTVDELIEMKVWKPQMGVPVKKS